MSGDGAVESGPGSGPAGARGADGCVLLDSSGDDRSARRRGGLGRRGGRLRGAGAGRRLGGRRDEAGDGIGGGASNQVHVVGAAPGLGVLVVGAVVSSLARVYSHSHVSKVARGA